MSRRRGRATVPAACEDWSPISEAMDYLNYEIAVHALTGVYPHQGVSPENHHPKETPEMSITHQVLAVTPKMAAEMLAHNTHNRRMFGETVSQLAADMKAGRWHMTGDAVKFDKEGHLLDGQHRLAAIVEANVVVPLVVIRDLDPDSQDYMDLGRKRSIADALILEGKVQHRQSAVGAIARGVLLLEKAGQPKGLHRPTHAEVLERIRQTPDRFEEAAYVSGQAHTQGLRGGIIYGLAYYYLSQIDAQDAEKFFEALITGADLHQGQPIYALRQKFIKDAPRPSRQAYDLSVNLAYIYKAWNYFRANRPLIVLRLGRDENTVKPI